jgi:hypothetical protein
MTALERCRVGTIPILLTHTPLELSNRIIRMLFHPLFHLAFNDTNLVYAATQQNRVSPDLKSDRLVRKNNEGVGEAFGAMRQTMMKLITFVTNVFLEHGMEYQSCRACVLHPLDVVKIFAQRRSGRYQWRPQYHTQITRC